MFNKNLNFGSWYSYMWRFFLLRLTYLQNIENDIKLDNALASNPVVDDTYICSIAFTWEDVQDKKICMLRTNPGFYTNARRCSTSRESPTCLPENCYSNHKHNQTSEIAKLCCHRSLKLPAQKHLRLQQETSWHDQIRGRQRIRALPFSNCAFDKYLTWLRLFGIDLIQIFRD